RVRGRARTLECAHVRARCGIAPDTQPAGTNIARPRPRRKPDYFQPGAAGTASLAFDPRDARNRASRAPSDRFNRTHEFPEGSGDGPAGAVSNARLELARSHREGCAQRDGTG